MNCKTTQSRLSAFVDRELSGAEMHEIRQHLSVCASCQGEEEAFRCLKQLLGTGSTVEPPEDFEDRLVRNVLGPAEAAPVRQRPAYWLAACAAAAAMIATLCVLPSIKGVPKLMVPTNSSKSNDFALEINRDQLYEASSDPLSGGHLASPAVYGR